MNDHRTYLAPGQRYAQPGATGWRLDHQVTIARLDRHSLPARILDDFQAKLAVASVGENIAGELQDDNLDSRAIDIVESDRGRHLAPSPNRDIDINLAADRADHHCH